MQKRIACFFGCFTLTLVLNVSCLSQQSPPQRPPTAEQVLARFVQAVGGMTAYDNIKTKVLTESRIDWDGQQAQVEIYWKFPDKCLNIQHDLRYGYDGRVRWVQEGNHKPKRVKGSHGYDIENDVIFEDVLHWRDKFKKIEFAGEAEVLNRKTYVLNVICGRPASLYFDQQTGLLLRRDTRWEQSHVEVYYSNYVEIAGTKVPWRVEYVHFKTGKKYVTKLTEVKTNVPLDDAMFAMPTP
jgi:hypothetical protein